MKRSLSIILPLLLLSGCIAKAPEQGAIPTYQQVAMRYENPTDTQLLNFCQSKGGRYEVWTDDDGTKRTFCMLPQGYGCDPEQFFKGTCDVE